MRFRRELVGATTGPLILAALERGDAHGYEIVRRVGELSAGAFRWREGTIYPALHRLEKAGYIEGQWREGERGKQRRVYALTRDGRRELAARREEWEAYSKAVGAVLEVSHA